MYFSALLHVSEFLLWALFRRSVTGEAVSHEIRQPATTGLSLTLPNSAKTRHSELLFGWKIRSSPQSSSQTLIGACGMSYGVIGIYIAPLNS